MLSTLAGLVRFGPKVSELGQRLALWHPELPLIVLWSQKSGCTTVVKWVLYQVGELEAAERHSNWVHDYENQVFKARTGYRDGLKQALRDGRPVVKFVRDPAARAYSGYLELCNPRVVRSAFWQGLRRQVLAHLAPAHAVNLDYTFSFHDFVGWLESNIEKLLARERTALEYAVRRSCELKAGVVGADEREAGLRAILNFGHTFGHAIEAGVGYGEWLHGEAVGTGMVMAAELSARAGTLRREDAERVKRLIARAGLPTRGPKLAIERYLELMQVDKKAAAGKVLSEVLPEIGQLERGADGI